ncbi:GNAT family N-acetyltransferase [Aestuariibius sp. HNIBRBA575]|uniref:GNAT family N-acetyltransferase n=1 Tax=Aestuariibius sp. HNIBRBA575 TaxID=3233343 RepID=UPI0034A2DC36
MAVPTLTTTRLTLRPLVVKDVDAITDALSDFNITRWLTNAPFPYAKSDAQWFVQHVANHPDDMNWAIDAGDGLIGMIGVKPDLGYWLNANNHGQGIMTEAANCAVAWYFQNFSKPLASGHFQGSHASRAILTKLGFHDTHVEQVVPKATNAEITLHRMSLSQSDWANQND